MNTLGTGLFAIGLSQALHLVLKTNITMDLAVMTLCIGFMFIVWNKK